MLQRIRRFAVELHEDESGPNTVEWVLLVVIALIILLAIILVANWARGKMTAAKDEVEADGFLDP